MPSLFYLDANAVATQALAVAAPTRIDASGRVCEPAAGLSQPAAGLNRSPAGLSRSTAGLASGPASEAGFVASIVAISAAPLRLAVVAHADARVEVGARRVCGAEALEDRDRIFAAGRELLIGLDALPIQVPAPRDSVCGVCNRNAAESGSTWRACPRCGFRACEGCWTQFRGGVCLTAHCGQPAALERPLWSPVPTDFLDYSGDGAAWMEAQAR